MICHQIYSYNFLVYALPGCQKRINEGWRQCTARIPNNHTSNTHKVCRVPKMFSVERFQIIRMACSSWTVMVICQWTQLNPLRDQLGDKQHHHWSLDTHLQLATDALTATLTHIHLQLLKSQEEKRSLNRESWEADQCSWSYSID